MRTRVCYQKDNEQGIRFEIKCVKDNILSKEAKGQDASFERGLLKSWSKYPGYEGAKAALESCGTPLARRGKSKSVRFKERLVQ